MGEYSMELLTTAAKAQADDPGELEYWFAEKILDAVEPIIRADEREKAAQRIEALMLDPKDHCIEEYNAGLTNAASAARGESDG